MKLGIKIKQVQYYFKVYGFQKTIQKIISKIFDIKNKKKGKQSYQIWMQNNEPNQEELEKQKNTKFEINPKFSIVVPMYNTPILFFEELVDSLINQTYENWELCLADGSPEKNQELKSILNKDARIKYKFLKENKGISGNSNEALKLASRRLYCTFRS